MKQLLPIMLSTLAGCSSTLMITHNDKMCAVTADHPLEVTFESTKDPDSCVVTVKAEGDL